MELSSQPERENGVANAGKQGMAVVGPARRALGDIKNLVGNMRAYSSSLAGSKPPVGAPPPVAGRSLAPLQRRTSDNGSVESRRASASTSTSHFSRSASDISSRSHVSAQQLTSSAPSLPDIDSVDKRNPLAASDYAVDIYKYFHRVEANFLPSSAYMKKQTEITPWMRSVLVDWLVEVHLKFKLMPETLFLTINMIDRFLAAVPVRRKELQLVGVTAMFLASKYEEIWAPEVRDFVYICDKAYSRKQILEMEKKMINKLGFKVSLPTSYHFLHRYIKAADVEDPRIHFLVTYLVELALVDYEMLQHSYSETAAAATMLGLKSLGLGSSEWPVACEKHSGYTQEALSPCLAKLMELARKAAAPQSEMKAVQKKYSLPKLESVAKLPLRF